MGPTSAEIQAPERAAVAGVQGHGAREVELVQAHGAVEYVLWEEEPQPLAWGIVVFTAFVGVFPSPVL